jgi:outer membrane biosynthesis protein TonB
VTELAAPQISSLMEALPGIAAVLRSPVANAMVALCRSAAGLEEFQLQHAEELLRFGVRRNLLTPEEVDTVLDELRGVVAKRPPRPPPPPKPAPPKVEAPKVPHRPKGIQLKPASKRPPPPPPPPAKPKPKAAPAPVKKVMAKKAVPVKAASKAAPAKHAAAKPAHKPAKKR